MAKIIFRIAGIWGLLLLVPIFFLKDRIGTLAPPPITHPEYFYGFLSVTLIFQLLFLLIATDPVRYRPVMPIAMLEKFVYAGFIYWLAATRQAPSSQALFVSIDLLLGLLFVIAFLKTPRQA